jgi:RNA polymerase sigma factor (TIGR02999 family)
MRAVQPNDLTDLLIRWKAGDRAAQAQLIEALYPAMKMSAANALKRCTPGKISLSATDLVHECYLRLIQNRSGFQNRAHFLAVAAQTLKRVLLDLLKARATQKRGANQEFVALDFAEAGSLTSNAPLDLVQTLDLLERLHARDPVAADVFELRVFGGMTNEQAAEVLNIGVATAGRHFAFSKAFLLA